MLTLIVYILPIPAPFATLTCKPETLRWAIFFRVEKLGASVTGTSDAGQLHVDPLDCVMRKVGNIQLIQPQVGLCDNQRAGAQTAFLVVRIKLILNAF